MVARKKTNSPPSDFPTAENDALPAATPVISATMPMQIISSQTDVPTTYLEKRRDDHFISSITFARSVVDESQIAAPKKSDSTDPQPKNLVPTV